MSRSPGAPSGSAELQVWRLRAINLLAYAILLAPAGIALLWHGNNAGWPADDAATYMRTAYDQYLALTHGSFPEGIRSLYWTRGWRPIAFPLLAVPFLWLTNGNVLAAAAGALIACLLAWTVYAYAIARLYLKPLPAALAAVLTCTAPTLAGMVTVFLSESAWVAACTAFACHALRSDDFRNPRHALAAGCALAAAILIRPAETAATMAVPVVVILALAARRGTIGWRDLGLSALLAFIAESVLVTAIFVPYLDHGKIWPLCGILVLAGIAIAKRKQLPGSAGLAAFTTVVVALNLFWWADFMPRLYAWVHATSFGVMAQVTDVRMTRLGFTGVLDWLRQLYAGPQTVVIAAVAILAVMTGWWRRRSGGPAASPPWLLLLIGLGAIVPMLALYGWTGTSDPRRLIVGASFAVLVTAIYALADGPLHRLRIATIGAVATAQLLVFLAVARLDNQTVAFFSPGVLNTVLAPRQGIDPHQELVRQLLKAGVPKGSIVAVYTMGLHQGGSRVWEPFAAMVAAGTLGDPLMLTYRWEAGDYDAAIGLYRRLGVGYVLVEHFRDRESRTIRQPYVQFTMALLDRIEAGEVNPRGLELLGRFELGGRLNSVFKIIP